MASLDRILGELKENKIQTDRRLERIEAKVDSLQQSKWKNVGFYACLSIMISVASEIAFVVFR